MQLISEDGTGTVRVPRGVGTLARVTVNIVCKTILIKWRLDRGVLSVTMCRAQSRIF